MKKYVRILTDNQYWKDCKTGKLVPFSRHQDPCFYERFNGDYAYPAPVPLFAKPAGGGSSKRIPQRWWDYVRSINTPEAWKALRRNNGGWINYAANNEWPGGSTVPDTPDPMPRPESITSIGNVHEVLEQRNGATRIKAHKFSDAPPPLGVKDDLMICYFRSIDSKGKLGNAPDGIVSYFPLLVADEAWLPDEKLAFFDELPDEDETEPIPIEEPEDPPMTQELNFIDVSHHNGAAYKGNPLDWTAIRDAGIDGAIAKVWDAWYMLPDGYPDQQYDAEFLANWNGMSELTLRGAYIYGRFDTAAWRPESLAEQVAMAIDYIPSPRKAEDVFVLDIEQPASQIGHISLDSRADMLIDALDEAVLKGWPKEFIWIYTGAWWWNVQMPKVIPPAILEYPVWVAYYSDTLLDAGIPNGWSRDQVIAWQFSDSTILPGYPDQTLKFDGNDFLFDWDDYFDTANPTPPPDPEPPAPSDRNAILTEAQNAIEAIKD